MEFFFFVFHLGKSRNTFRSLRLCCLDKNIVLGRIRVEMITWIVACFTTMLLDVTLGLAISVAFVIMTLVLREQWPQLDWLASTEERDVFKPAGKYQGLLSTGETEDVKVLKFGCPLHFANVEKLVDFVSDYLVQIASAPPKSIKVTDLNGKTNVEDVRPQNTLVLDGGAIAYVDSMGIEALVECYKDAEKVGVRVFYADFSDLVIDSLTRAGFFQTVPKDNFFPTVRDAVETARTT
uniref:STAS domain-containing protein n=1 Tax=Bursaphelenchus xylophilus TaxID=6326 RepID=A0A1I7RMP8_BURXY